jgi:hypothetical protein
MLQNGFIDHFPIFLIKFYILSFFDMIICYYIDIPYSFILLRPFILSFIEENTYFLTIGVVTANWVSIGSGNFPFPLLC